MDQFLSSINELNDKYNDLYITYFLYRIWIKYKVLVNYVLSREEFNKTLSLLNIPENFHKLDIVFPLNNYMIFDNKDQLNTAFINNLTAIDTKLKNFEMVDPDEVEIKKLYDNFSLYINENNTPDKIDTILNQFRKKINLQYINVLISGLTQ